jgi:nucleotide-binding universal stress UspA family protein
MSAAKTILYPTDFSECSRAAFPLACSLARDQDALLVLLHVVPARNPDPFCSMNVESTEALEGDLKNYHDEMEARLAGLNPPEPATRVTRLVREGEAAGAILRAAGEVACDLIVMGTHGRTGEFHRLMGSVAEQVSRRAPCAVLTFRMGGAMSEPAKECLVGAARDARTGTPV